MEGECCILCREVHPTAVCAQRGLSPASVCQWKHVSLGHTNTSVSSPQSPHQSHHSARHCSVITHHRRLWRGLGGGSQTQTQTPSLTSASLQACVRKTERARKIGRVSEREGEVQTALSETKRRGKRRETLLLPVKNQRLCVRAHLDRD